ncbi:LAMI_0G08438g1_1 [Lachancea mirantina]|uniref:LAMI_0G08438g1_1 n=1 Tax=Lachancea mirantina TaxID=1230905 RepID=A0A1G4KA08_9SACH|nr:LAMI_0G08438g1_1 [Lachancea mirantina]
MNALVERINKTINNLKSKNDFLNEQKQHYENIRSHLLAYDGKQFRLLEEKDGQSGIKGLVFGEIIISSKIFLNLGYEFFVEKTQGEAIRFVTSKIELMEDAIRSFEEKITETEGTLKTMQDIANHENSEAEVAGQGLVEDYKNEDGLHFMEIREELDEEGNVIGSAVKPTSVEAAFTPNPRDSDQDHKHTKIEEIGRSDGEKFDSEFENGVRGIFETRNQQQNDRAQPTASNIDTDQFYTLDEMVRQLDLQDNEEDGEIDENDICYDFDSYKEQHMASGDESDEDEDDEDDYNFQSSGKMPFIVPGRAKSSFMEQISKLREEKLKTQPQIQNRPILKDSKPQESPKSSKSKRSVGFAPELDIYEVDNVKAETKNNTFKAFTAEAPSPQLDADGFDPDLFAELIGAKSSDALHEKYEKQENEGVSDTKPVKIPRVSRFKKDRQATSAAQDSQKRLPSADSAEAKSAVGDIVERMVEKEKYTSPGQDADISEGEKGKEFRKDSSDALQEVVSRPSVNYHALGTNVDDMARAYLLGMYDDDLDDAGVVVEKLEDFPEYNEKAESLKPEVERFVRENPMQSSSSADLDTNATKARDELDSVQSDALLTDIVEKDVPVEETPDDDDLFYDNLSSEVATEYTKLRHRLIATQSNIVDSEAELEFEPIDEHGNPVRVSKFKSAKLRTSFTRAL